jgi:hypothetical protein
LAVNERGEAFVTWSDNRITGSPQLYDIFSSWGVRKQNMVEDRRTERFEKSFRVDCYPNPFTDRIRIQFFQSQEGKTGFIIYNLLGEKVKTFEPGLKGPGRYEIEWKGVDEKGEQVKSGIYFLRFYQENMNHPICPAKDLFKLILTR